MKTIVYYTCNTHLPQIDELAREYLSKVTLPVISVSLNKPVDFGDLRFVIEGKRDPVMMHRQIVKGLQAVKTKYVFFAESDVLYHTSHFDFTPVKDDVYYFNVNVWKQRWPEQYFVRTDNSQQTSGMSCATGLALDFYTTRLEELEKKVFDRHYEPKGPRENYESKVPLICIRHNRNLTHSKWSPADYRNKEYAKGFRQATSVPGWSL